MSQMASNTVWDLVSDSMTLIASVPQRKSGSMDRVPIRSGMRKHRSEVMMEFLLRLEYPLHQERR